MICIYYQILCSWLTLLKISEKLVWSFPSWILLTISLALDYHGMLCNGWLTYNWNSWLISLASVYPEKGKRGGTRYIAQRNGEANNKYMRNNNKTKPSKYISYLVANNLYGWEMSKYVPTRGFRWMTEKQINKTDLGKYKDDSKTGIILEVDWCWKHVYFMHLKRKELQRKEMRCRKMTLN